MTVEGIKSFSILLRQVNSNDENQLQLNNTLEESLYRNSGCNYVRGRGEEGSSRTVFGTAKWRENKWKSGDPGFAPPLTLVMVNFKKPENSWNLSLKQAHAALATGLFVWEQKHLVTKFFLKSNREQKPETGRTLNATHFLFFRASTTGPPRSASWRPWRQRAPTTTSSSSSTTRHRRSLQRSSKDRVTS